MSKRVWVYWSIMTIFSFLYNSLLPLHPDEAYYWVWSRNLQLSYFDHPPMVAYLIKIITFLGTSEVVIRSIAVLCISISAYFIYRMARDMFSERTAEIALLLFLIMPVVQAGFIVVTPDSPLVLFWTLTVYFSYQFLFKGKRNMIYIAGISAGFLLLSKYTGVLLLGSLFLYILLSQHKKLLKERHIYFAVLLAFVIFLPVIIWNYQNDWISFKFQFSHGVSAEKKFNFSTLGEYLGLQMMVFNPVFFVTVMSLFFAKMKEIYKNKYLYFLSYPFLLTFLFFMYQASFKKSEANWAAPAYITGVILLAYFIEHYRLKKVFYSGIIIGLLLFMVARFPEAIPGYPEEAVLKSKFMGYNEVFSKASGYMSKRGVILSDSYQNASEAEYYLQGRPDVYIITESRFSNYNYWSQDIKEKITNKEVNSAVYIGEKDKKDELYNYFSDVTLKDIIIYKGRYVDRKFYIYSCTL